MEVNASPNGKYFTPSVISFDDAEILVGDVALASVARNTPNMVQVHAWRHSRRA